MANRRNYFYLQLLEDDELDAGFEGLEQADHDMVVDLGFTGIAGGAGVSQHSPTPDLTVDVAIGTAHDQQGRRMRIPSLQVVNVAVDSNAVSTSVTTPGQSKIISVFLRFARNQSDPRTDGNGAPVNFVQDEGFEFVVVQSAEAVTPTPPALLSNGLLLADITRTQGQTQIVTGNLSTARRQFTIQISAGAISISTGTVEEAMQATLTALNNHITSVANNHPASTITYAAGPTWANGGTNPGTHVQAQIDKMITELSAIGATGGTHRIGTSAQDVTVGAYTLSFPAEAVNVRLQRLQGAIVSPALSWTVPAKALPENNVRDLVATVVAHLSLQTGGDDGMRLVGGQAVASTPTSLSAGSARSQATELLTAVNARALLANGARAWGVLTLDGSGGLVVSDHVGVNGTPAITSGGSGYVTVTLTAARPDVNYAADAFDTTQNSSTLRHARVTNRTTTTFRIYWYDATGTIIDPATTAGVLGFYLFDNA